MFLISKIQENCFFFIFPKQVFENRKQVTKHNLSFSHIVCVCLVLCSCLFGYKFALICGDIVLMLNLIIIIIIIIIIVIQKIMSNPLVQADPHGLGWIRIFFNQP